MQKISNLVKFDESVLKSDFYLAKKDADFKNLVDKLNIPDDTLINYTTKLIASVEETKNCTNCGGLSECKNNTLGYFLCPKNDHGSLSFSYKTCRYMDKKLASTSHLKNMFLFDVPDELKKASIKNIYNDDKARMNLIKMIKKFYDEYIENKNPKGIYLHGSFGSGKSYIIAALFNEFAKRDVKSAIIYFPEFLRSLKGTFGDNTDYNELFEYIKKIPLLLIDDIGAEKVSEWGRDEVLGSILQYRMDQKLPTFFTSNLSLDELESHLSVVNNTVDKVKSRRIIERISFLSNDASLIGVNRRK